MNNLFNMISLKKMERQFSKKSYSQCGEDLIVSFIFTTLGIKNPSYLDIGAHHPVYLSNTYLLYRNGSRGVCVEPDPILFKRIKRIRKDDICLNVGVGTKYQESADFFIMTTPTLNTFSREEAERYQSMGQQKIESVITIPIIPVNEILAQNFKGGPNFLSLDVEGLDFAILKEINFSNYRPQVICVETITYSENRTGKKLDEIIDYMVANNYFIYSDTYINTIFVDKFAWDNK